MNGRETLSRLFWIPEGKTTETKTTESFQLTGYLLLLTEETEEG